MAVIHRSPPTPPLLGIAARAFRVAATRRCPRCGEGHIWSSWLTLAPRCPECGFVPDRGESDYFIGAYLVNFIVAELLVVVAFIFAMIVTWPSPPWDALLWGTAALAVLSPVVAYPFTVTFWLAVDLALRPEGT